MKGKNAKEGVRVGGGDVILRILGSQIIALFLGLLW